MRGRRMFAAAMLPALMANQCIRMIDVRADTDAAGEPPSFFLAFDGERLSVVKWFEVTECARGAGGSMWRIVPDGRTQHRGEPLRITYGRVPHGYEESRPARPLEPGGCYDVDAEGIGLPAFPGGGETLRVLPNGRVVAGNPGGLLGSSRPYRQLNRAAVGCARRYRRAATAADSAAVDAREHAVLDAHPTCGWLGEHWPDLMSDPVTTEHGLLATLGTVAALALLVFIGEQAEPE